MPRKILVFKHSQEIADFLIERWKEISQLAISDKGIFTVALSGGRTPIPLYKKLADTESLPWGKTHIFLTDERFVPMDSPDSNYRMIKESLLDRISIPCGNMHPITIEDTANDSAKKYENDIKDFFKSTKHNLPQFDMMIIGLGQDGHIASLFPGNIALAEKEHFALAARQEKIEQERISLSLPVINNSKNIIFLVTGRNKSKVVKKILKEQDSTLPGTLVNPERGELLFLLDAAAGSLLSLESKSLYPVKSSKAPSFRAGI